MASALPFSDDKTGKLGSKQVQHSCRFCDTPLQQLVVDLGMQPLCESYVEHDKLDAMEAFYPIKAYVCDSCYLVQVLDFVPAEDIYSHYAYFSSYSDSWLVHVRDYVEQVVPRFSLDRNSQVVEIASNDGYLLQYLAEKQIPVLGVEPAANVAQVAIDKGIPTTVRFFGRETAKTLVSEGKRADLLIGNNVFGHVPDINDFVAGMKILLAETGVLTIEIPHVYHTLGGNQFDQIYQEHYSYYSLIAAKNIFEAHSLRIFDVDEISTHGGSLRYYVCHTNDSSKPVEKSVARVEAMEREAGYDTMDVYQAFGERVIETKRNLLEFLIEAKRQNKQVAAYGAPGKGTTLLNYCGIREDFIDYAVDRNTFKIGKYMPGVHVPIHAPEKLEETRPDFIILLPWNLKDELMNQLDYAREWGAKFVVPIPELKIYD